MSRPSGDHAASTVFPTEFGWVALVCTPRGLRRLTFGHATPDQALRELEGAASGTVAPPSADLVERIQRFLAGEADDLLDVTLDLAPQTEFQARVRNCCRRIPYGKTTTYAELARSAGRPRAARAVGNCMASNPVPLFIPCHRVLGAGDLGGFSARQGLAMKKRLLALESSHA